MNKIKDIIEKLEILEGVKKHAHSLEQALDIQGEINRLKNLEVKS